MRVAQVDKYLFMWDLVKILTKEACNCPGDKTNFEDKITIIWQL